MIGDPDFNVSKLYGMLPAAVSGDPAKRTPADNQTVRNVFVIGPDKKIKLVLVYPMTTGRNFDEVLRVIDSLQLTAKHKVATPVNWKHGEDVIIAGSVSDDDAKKHYPQGWKAPKPYIRIVPQPPAKLRRPRGRDGARGARRAHRAGHRRRRGGRRRRRRARPRAQRRPKSPGGGGGPHRGGGATNVGGVAAGWWNAFFSATGNHVRSLPLKGHYLRKP